MNRGDNVLIGGLIASKGLTKVVVRAIGPTLAKFGITNPLLDPTRELYDDSGTPVAINDGWQTSQKSDLEETTLQPGDSRESAIFAALPAGQLYGGRAREEWRDGDRGGGGV